MKTPLLTPPNWGKGISVGHRLTPISTTDKVTQLRVALREMFSPVRL